MRIKILAILALLLFTLPLRAADPPVQLKWLETPPQVQTGISWGVPYPRAAVKKDQAFALTTADGKQLPLQTWPLAYWPDGSIKWNGYATLAAPQLAGPLSLAPAAAAPAAPEVKVSVTQTADAIDINTGAGGMTCHINAKGGDNLFDTLKIGNRTIAENAHLDCILQLGPEIDPARPPGREAFISRVEKITVEQSGPVRAVVKFEGMHRGVTGQRLWLPFYVRLYFYPGISPIRMVHSIVFDGNEKQDFIRGLGITVNVPFAEEIQNRHVRFGGQQPAAAPTALPFASTAQLGGLWAEPVEPLTGYNLTFTNPGSQNAYADQIAGHRMGNRAQLPANSVRAIDAWAKWDDFRLLQLSPSGFTIEKRTGDQSSWVPAGTGTRAGGMVYAGDVSGGLAIGLKDFWQKYPASLEVRHARTDSAQIHVWLWSPDGPAMDMRHYDIVAHGLQESYEDVQPGLSTAVGIGRTAELTLFPCTAVPSHEDSARQVLTAEDPPLLVASPQYLHDQKAFGFWALQDRSSDFKKSVEDYLDAEIAFYEKAVDQYNWYGFWNYGNVMHSYDANRQVWKYDIGGFAWDNSEQGTDMFLWYSFLRTGRADIFRFAEAMSRQTGEVEFYHQGPMAGLGTRHNVSPWGDGAKEARISMAPYRRFYYYLTTDERTGDIMHETLQSEVAITKYDPMREADPPVAGDEKYPARIRAGPDWFAFVGNWMTEWERTGNTKYRDKIITGMDSIQAMPFHFSTGRNLLWGFYPDTGKLVARDQNRGGYNLVTNMGGPEVIMELNEFIDHPAWNQIWLEYAQGGGGRQGAYYYYITKNAQSAQGAINAIRPGNNPGQGAGGNFLVPLQTLSGPNELKPMEVPQGLSGLVTNNVNQHSLNMIEVLELCKDRIP